MKFVKPLLLIVILSLLTISGSAQIKGKVDSLTYNVGYFGNNGWNEGLQLSIENPRNLSYKTNKKGKQRIIEQSHSLHLNFYQDNGSHSAVFITAGWSKKKIFKNRFNFTTSAEPFGLYRSFLPETYKVKDDGAIKRSFLPGRFYLAPSVSAGIGRMGRWHPDNGWYARINLTTLMPYNRSIMPLLNVELGYHFKLKSANQ